MKSYLSFPKIIIVILFLFFPKYLFGQYPNIRVSHPDSYSPEEVTISINPTNPLNLAAGANINYYYYSFDGGLTWTEGQLSSSLGVYGDPCVVFDADGNLYYSHLSDPVDGAWLDRMVVQKSTNGGLAWNDGVGVGLNPPKMQDKEWMATDFTNSQYHNNLYMTWTEFDQYGSPDPEDSTRILFSHSTDFAENWSLPITVSDVGGSCLDGDASVEGAVPAIGPNGEIYVSWAGPLGILFDKSMDGGLTFGVDVFVTDQPGGWDFDIPGIFRCNGFPVTACDISNSIYRGNIYIMWSDQRNGIDNTDVFIKKSTDGGETWGNIVQVNDDASNRHQFFPWITIDQMTGAIYVVFYDRRNTIGDGTDVYVAKSTDGGESFINFQVSQSSFMPDANIFFGDYINIAARAGKVYPIWMRMDGYDLSVWVALIDDSTSTDIEAADTKLVKDLLLRQNRPNPFNPLTTISYSLPNSDFVTLRIYDMLGREIQILTDEFQKKGQYSLNFDAGKLASGVYFYQLQTSDFREIKKMLLLR